MRNWSDVAVLAKTRNLDGGFVVKSAANLPFLLDEGDEVAFVPPVLDAPRRGVVLDVRFLDDDSAVVHFDSVVDKNTAEQLAGCHCLVQLTQEQRDYIAQTPVSWDGWSVVDTEFGLIGHINEVIENPGQMLLSVKRADRSNPEAQDDILIPVVDEFIVGIDADSQIVETHIPAGLLSL